MQRNAKGRLHVEITRICHDLVFSPSDITPNLVTSTPAPEHLAMERYEEYCRDFYIEGVDISRQYIIKKISQEWQLILKWSFLETYNIVNSVSNTLLLNELEIVYWSILLKVKVEGMKPLLYAYFTAFLTKLSLNNDVYPFEVYLNSLIPNFKLHFYNWQLVSDFPTEVTVRDLNQRFKQLREISIKNTKNYEIMVEQLMQIPRRKESIMSESFFSEISLENIDRSSLEEFEIDLLIEAKNAKIDKLED
jgi:hypothetical protein